MVRSIAKVVWWLALAEILLLLLGVSNWWWVGGLSAGLVFLGITLKMLIARYGGQGPARVRAWVARMSGMQGILGPDLEVDRGAVRAQRGDVRPLVARTDALSPATADRRTQAGIRLKRTFRGSRRLQISLDEDVPLSLGGRESTEVMVAPGKHQIVAEFLVVKPAVGRIVVAVSAGEVLELAFRLRMRWRVLLYVYVRTALARTYLVRNPSNEEISAIGYVDIVEVEKRAGLGWRRFLSGTYRALGAVGHRVRRRGI